MGVYTLRKSKLCKNLPIFDDEAAYNLKRHKYSGTDKGILYTWFYSPIATKLVNCLPDWMAPNLITTIGFIHTIIPLCVLFAVDDFTLLGPVPRWFCFLQAWCYFAYRMLDEMDGKQARKTQNSSPLGLIFDHGVDAWSTGLQALIALRVLQCGNNFLSYAMLVTAMAGFHFATIEEYYVGTLYLPPCNAVSDGSVLVIGMFLFSGIIGNDFWVKEVVDGSWMNIEGIEELTIGQIVIAVMTLMAFLL